MVQDVLRQEPAALSILRAQSLRCLNFRRPAVPPAETSPKGGLAYGPGTALRGLFLAWAVRSAILRRRVVYPSTTPRLFAARPRRRGDRIGRPVVAFGGRAEVTVLASDFAFDPTAVLAGTFSNWLVLSRSHRRPLSHSDVQRNDAFANFAASFSYLSAAYRQPPAARVYLAGRSEKRKYSPQLGSHLGNPV